MVKVTKTTAVFFYWKRTYIQRRNKIQVCLNVVIRVGNLI